GPRHFRLAGGDDFARQGDGGRRQVFRRTRQRPISQTQNPERDSRRPGALTLEHDPEKARPRTMMRGGYRFLGSRPLPGSFRLGSIVPSRIVHSARLRQPLPDKPLKNSVLTCYIRSKWILTWRNPPWQIDLFLSPPQELSKLLPAIFPSPENAAVSLSGYWRNE